MRAEGKCAGTVIPLYASADNEIGGNGYGREPKRGPERKRLSERENGYREIFLVPIDSDRIDRLIRPRAPVLIDCPTLDKDPSVRRSVRERPSDRSVTVRASIDSVVDDCLLMCLIACRTDFDGLVGMVGLLARVTRPGLIADRTEPTLGDGRTD
ncbi:unnamed protein product [Microthlaspi erraticum]|uniref:Uncharacterized protein n=1 Tax=Microthlaspi erraticum TaxID=1685480 RepID=A0A6D2HM19_9BRAS|nr:unnamed protein product [Microthlaspi erraticum]